MKNKIPKLKTDTQVRDFWSRHGSTSYIDWSKAHTAVFPNVRPTLKTISLRVPEFLLNELKVLANKRDVPYQSLLKMFLAERVEKELRQNSRTTRQRSPS